MTSDQPMRPEGGCSLPGSNGSRIPIDEPHAYSSHKGANTIFVRTCDLCGAIDWDALHEATVERVAAEVSRLHSWDGLMSLLDEHWPEDLHPTLDDDPARDPGARIVSLLRWVDRLRTQLRNSEQCAVRELQAQVRADEFEEEADRLRAENTAQAAQVAAVRSMPQIEIGLHWNAQSEAEATGRNATLLEMRRILNGSEPQRGDRTQSDVLRDFERDMRTVRALGLVQDREGQADD